MNYEEARAKAQALANATGQDHGVERLTSEWAGGGKRAKADAALEAVGLGGYHVFGLPQVHNRYGHEVLCEVVSATDLNKCQPGHGPCATRAKYLQVPS